MLAGILKFIDAHKMIRHDGRVLLAVSGGIDSMVMAHLFLHLPFTCAIAHCNFSLRGQESDGDEELVRNFCTGHNIPFYTNRFETKSFAKSKGISIQMAARELRYEWFEEIRSKNNYDHIAVAHNLNDNIETLLINLIRGTGLQGLSGMKPVSGHIIRPLLFATREQISRYQQEHNILFREDRSNADTKYSRNKIRHMVLPVMKQINPSLENTLSETALRFSELNAIIEEVVTEIKRKTVLNEGGSTIINLKYLEENINSRTILFEVFREYGVNNKMLDDILNLINGRTGSQLFTDTHRIVKDREKLIISVKNGNDDTREIIISDVNDFTQNNIVKSAELVERIKLQEIIPDQSVACLDYGKVIFPVTLRKWRKGDFFHPFGMKGKKKLSDYFTDKKYSLPDKEKKLVLESDGKIIWVVGDRIDERFRITDETDRVLILKS